MSASIASGQLESDLAELSAAELEFLRYDWELWAREEQLAPLYVALGDSRSASRPPSALVARRKSEWNFVVEGLVEAALGTAATRLRRNPARLAPT